MRLSRFARCASVGNPRILPPRATMPSGQSDRFERCLLSVNRYVAAYL